MNEKNFFVEFFLLVFCYFVLLITFYFLFIKNVLYNIFNLLNNTMYLLSNKKEGKEKKTEGCRRKQKKIESSPRFYNLLLSSLDKKCFSFVIRIFSSTPKFVLFILSLKNKKNTKNQKAKKRKIPVEIYVKIKMCYSFIRYFSFFHFFGNSNFRIHPPNRV